MVSLTNVTHCIYNIVEFLRFILDLTDHMSECIYAVCVSLRACLNLKSDSWTIRFVFLSYFFISLHQVSSDLNYVNMSQSLDKTEDIGKYW